MKRKAIFCCTCAVISCWFLLILFMTLTKVDDEYTKGLLEIDKTYNKWRQKKSSDGAKKTDSQKSWYLEKRDDLSNLLPKNQRGRLIRNWLSSDEEQNTRPENISVKRIDNKRFDVAKDFLIRKMREKIISIYGDVLTVPVNDSSFVKVRNWKKKEENDVINKNSQENYSYNFLPVSQEMIIEKSKSLEKGEEKNMNSTTARPNMWSPKSLIAPYKSDDNSNKIMTIINDTLTKDFSTGKPANSIRSLGATQKTLNDVTKNKSHVFNDAMMRNISNKVKRNESLDTEPSVLGTGPSVLDTGPFALSLNETKYLRKLFLQKDDFIDKGESNAHHELGPVNTYTDVVLDEDRRNYAKKPRKKIKMKKIRERKFERKQISIVVSHKRNLHHEKKKTKEFFKETPPPGAETKQRK